MLDYIVFDLETTCWDGNPPTDIREVIEIGAYRLTEYAETVDHFHSLVRPTYFPVLSPYCKNLTQIEQEEVNNARTFPVVMERFIDFVEKIDKEYMLCAWGPSDQKILQKECMAHAIEFEGLSHYIDVKKQYHEMHRLKKQNGFMKTLRKEGIEFEGSPHRADSDAFNLTKLFSRYVDQWVY